MTPIYTKDCQRGACGRAFTTTRANVVYCSVRCADLERRRFPRATASTTSNSNDSIKPVVTAVHVEKPTWAKIRARVIKHFRGPLWSEVVEENLRKNCENQGEMCVSAGELPVSS